MTNYTPEQIAANRANWLTALRSGKYKQGQSSLRNGDSFCCLGVACDLFDATGWVGNGYGGKTTVFFPPEEVRLSLGLPGPLAFGPFEDGQLSLTSYVATMNDAGRSFAEIADFLEQEFSK